MTQKCIAILLAIIAMASLVVAQPPIARVEYFFDNDPGLGNGIGLPTASSQNISSQQASIAIGALANGIHTLYIRSCNSEGIWSVTNSQSFLKTNNNVSPITTAEYFIDTDPGFGNAKAISISASDNIGRQSIIASLDLLDNGIHTFYIRSRNGAGQWSITNQQIFYKSDHIRQPVDAAEYFIDTDPGFGKATPLAINAADSLVKFAMPINITGLANGKHVFFMRTKNLSGKWGITNSHEFTVSNTGAMPFINVNSSTDKQMCAYRSFRLAFDAKGNYASDNVFTAQLSDANGSFANPYTIGTVASTTSAVIHAILPSHLPDGNNYKVRVVSSNAAFTGIPSDTLYQLRDRPNLGPDTLAAIVCPGETINLNTLYNTAGLTANWNTANTNAAPMGTYQLIAANNSGCKDTALAMVKQKVTVWNGAVSTDWHNAANWNTNRVPDSKTHVIIPAGTSNACSISISDGTAASLQIKTGAVINITNGRKLHILANCNPLPSQ